MPIKNFWKDHKREILFTGGAIVGGIMAMYVLGGRKISKAAVETIVENDLTYPFTWTFETIEEAVQKFKEVETVCVTLGQGEAAMFGGQPGNLTVMYL